ncbi:MAG: hypothetical protein R2827_14465 [Bdellovibrionales bacterium]
MQELIHIISEDYGDLLYEMALNPDIDKSFGKIDVFRKNKHQILEQSLTLSIQNFIHLDFRKN